MGAKQIKSQFGESGIAPKSVSPSLQAVMEARLMRANVHHLAMRYAARVCVQKIPGCELVGGPSKR